MKKLTTLIFVFTITCFTQNIKEIRILHWNDFHARNTPAKITKIDTVAGTDNSYYVGGTANMLGYLNKYRTPSSLVLNGGDDYQGSPISTITRGRSQIRLLNLYNLDAFVLGNHEFDYGQFSLDSALQEEAKFDFLSANIYLRSKNRTMGLRHVVKEKDGIRFGIIGITAPDLKNLSLPANVDDLTILNTDSVIAASISELKKEKCDVIMLLTHIGVDNDKKLAQKFFPDLDIIVGGHSHTPLFKPVVENGVIIVQAGSYSRWLGQLDIKVDADKDTILSYNGKLIETVDDPSLTDSRAKEIVDGMLAEINKTLMRVIGKLEQDWIPAYGDESNVGQFNAEAFRRATNSDIGFMNGGGTRKSLAKGDITLNDMWEINPFGNELVTFEVSGKTLKDMVRNSVRIRLNAAKKNVRNDLIITAGLAYKYDSKKYYAGDNDYVLEVTVNDIPVEDNKMYKIVSNNYVSSQFEKFFGRQDEKIEFTEAHLIDRDVLIEEVEKQKVINSVLQNRIVDVSSGK